MLDQVTVPALAFDGSFNFMPNFSRQREDRCCPACAPYPSAAKTEGEEGRTLVAELCACAEAFSSPVNTRARSDILHGKQLC